MLAGLTAALVTVTLPAAPAAAAVADHFHVARSTSTSWPARSATVSCPPGQVVWGFGGLTIGGTGHVALTAVYPDPELGSVTAIARVRDGWQGPWAVRATATCWPAGNVGLVRVGGQGGASAEASCPGQKRVYASGFEVTAAKGAAYAAAVVPEPDMSGVTVRAGGSESADLGTRAYALCGLVNTPQIYIYRRTEETVAVDPGASTSAAAPPMSHSPSGWSWVTGAGASSTRTDMFIDALGPNPELSLGTARMSRVSTTTASQRMAGVEEGGDEVTVWGTCIGAWY